jgi:hypothetical protein
VCVEIVCRLCVRRDCLQAVRASRLFCPTLVQWLTLSRRSALSEHKLAIWSVNSFLFDLICLLQNVWICHGVVIDTVRACAYMKWKGAIREVINHGWITCVHCASITCASVTTVLLIERLSNLIKCPRKEWFLTDRQLLISR